MFDRSHYSHLRVLLITGLIVVTSLMAGQVVLAAAPPASTTTQLTITSGGQPVSPGGSIASGSVVTLTATVMAGATIYYTTNGSTPTTSSAQYTGPITVSATETLVASALAYGYSMSPATSASYFIAGSTNSFIYTVAGNGTNGYSGDGGPATVADLNSPLGTVSDSAGNLYIADSYNQVIRKVAAGTGVITTFAGTGIGGYSGDNGPATSAQLDYPDGVALDSAGNLTSRIPATASFGWFRHQPE